MMREAETRPAPGRRRVRVVGVETIISGGFALVMYVLILVAVYKIFQISSDVSKIQETLKAMKSAAPPTPGAVVAPAVDRPDSAEALVRAVHAASYEELEDAISEPGDSKPA